MKALDAYCAALLRAAICTLFPKAIFHGSSLTSRGFQTTFSDDHPFQQGYLRMLEETMQKLAKEPSQIMEMLGSNAMEMLKYYGQPIDHSFKGTVFVLKIGSRFEVCPSKPQVAGDFSLLSFSKSRNRTTIWGKGFESQKSRQQFAKKFRKWTDHKQIAKKFELYEESTWHPRGILLKNFISNFRRNFLQSWGFLEVDSPDPIAYAQKYKLDRLFCLEKSYLFGPEALNLSLQIIQKWTTIFNFESQWVASERKLKQGMQKVLDHAQISPERDRDIPHLSLELRVADYLGCYHRGAHAELVEQGACFSLASDLDNWIALLLEKDKGKLPQWLSPEQVRLITEKGIDISEVTKIFRMANIRYTVDQKEQPLKEKIYRALRVNVPYVMVFGKREEKANQMMVRASNSSKSETIFLTQLHPFLSELPIESK